MSQHPYGTAIEELARQSCAGQGRLADGRLAAGASPRLADDDGPKSRAAATSKREETERCRRGAALDSPCRSIPGG
jgi:hypothetical protein